MRTLRLLGVTLVGLGLVTSAFGGSPPRARTSLDVRVTTQGHLTSAYAWTIGKSASPVTQSLAVGSVGSVHWTITTTRSATGAAGAWFEGRVCVKNTGPAATQGLAITDTLTEPPAKAPIVTVTVDTSAKPQLAPGERHCYPYRVTLPASAIDPGRRYKDTAFVALTNWNQHRPRMHAQAHDWLPTTPTSVDGSISVTDSNGKSFTFAAGGSEGYDQSVACEAADGPHTITATNTATIESTGQQASAQARVECTAATPSGESSQGLIQADLDAGRISYGQSLIYRAWTLFWDARLPARYDGTGSTGEDLSLFPEIEAALPSLPPDQQAELEGWIARPTSPLSPFGPAAASQMRVNAAEEDTADKCTAPNDWFHRDDPDDTTATGFRAWICASSQGEADPILSDVLTELAGIAPLFTQPEPAGMGRPVPDTLAPDNGGNGKIDVYLLATNQCRERNGSCEQIEGDDLAAAPPDGPIGSASGFPARSSSGYIIVSLANRDDPPTLAHELFHILQFAHTVGGLKGAFGNTAQSWYVEASATWAEWHPNLRQLSKAELYARFQGFQDDDSSLLLDGPHAYRSWIWPLFQELEGGGATAVYQSWAAAESASSPAGIDAAVDSKLPFAASFRDFSVWNLQPPEYFANSDSGLEDDSWQSPIPDFPKRPHFSDRLSLGLGARSIPALVDPLNAQDSGFTITDPRVRQVTIDLSPLQNAGSADLDIVGRIASDTKPYKWRRIRVDSSTYTFCRDLEEEDFDRFYVVLSNHASTQDASSGGPAEAARIRGSYNIEPKDRCDVPIRYEGTFQVNETVSPSTPTLLLHAEGHVTFKYLSTEATCFSGSGVPPTPDSLEYCYALDSAQETWTAPPYTVGDPPCTYVPRDAQFSYPNDDGRHGILSIRIRSPEPSSANTYFMFMGSNTKTMEIDGCSGTSTIGLPFYAIISQGCYTTVPPARFTGWPLSGSCKFDDDARDFVRTTIWSWNLTPIFQP
jgi:Family of unknown function (DUF6055)